MKSERETKQKAKNVDWITIILVLTLIAFGTITIANVMSDPFTGEESSVADVYAKINMDYVQRHIVNFLVGLAAMIAMLVIDYNLYKIVIKYVYWGNILLLAILLLIGNSTRGIFGWFTIGARAFQPSEVCKVTLTIMLSKIANDVVEREGAIKSLKSMGVILLYFGVPFILVLLQPDFGTAIVFLAILVCILFISKISWKYILGALALVAAIVPVSYFYLMSDEQKKRIEVFLDPEMDPTGYGMHVMRSKEAIGSGQLYGKGYFSEGTLAQLKYVPERHTDFVFSGIGEGFGFIGGTVLIVLYFLLIFHWVWIAFRAKDHMGTCLAIGSAGVMLAHVFENIGMTIGLMPVTGIPLPFISYGGSNLLTNMIFVGIILNVWMRRQQKR